jgi:uroporphyrin-3 C-methyltransferase
MTSTNGDKPVSIENDEQEFDPFELEDERKAVRTGGAGIAWLALVLALAVAAYNGYQGWLQWQAGDAQAGREAALAELRGQQESLDRSLQALNRRVAETEQGDTASRVALLGSAVDDLRAQLGELDTAAIDTQSRDQALQAALFDLRQSVTALEASVAALASRGQSPGQRLDILEVESLLRMASERLQLFADPRAADEALLLADQRLATMEDPLYLPVRKRINRARQVLASLAVPDLVELDGRISALQGGIAALPFPGDRPPAAAPGEASAEGEGAWARLKQTLASLVTVRRSTPEDAAAISLDDKDYLRQGVWLQLESARLSVMRKDAGGYSRSLNRARDTLASHFDPGAEAVRAAMAEIDDLLQAPIEVEMPDISAPWSQLQLLRKRAAAPEAGPPAVQEANEAEAAPEDSAAAGAGDG